ncbi:hypothetical protein E3P99_02666 [Wallemia hederae]|uniref:Phosducin domain-containing protein n=1 Tax=Wallemia hederae TaxID=1540922 RepID=A0A4T0FJS9_9BASI|nr:hypothetical protein E3P99_02666 [Wallemia hederae]
MFNPFEAAQGGGSDDRTYLSENQPHRPTTGALRYSDDTEFNDALRAQGILPQKPPSRPSTPEGLDIDYSQIRNAGLSLATEDTLAEAAEDADDSEDERVLLSYRKKRMQEMQKLESSARFGRMFPIARPDYTREVTDASKEHTDPQFSQTDDSIENLKRGGTSVICFLYSEAIEESRIIGQHLHALAAEYPHTKFVSIVGSQCIAGYPEHNCPTLLFYRRGTLMKQIVGASDAGIGLHGKQTTKKDVENLLLALEAVKLKPVNTNAHDFAKKDEQDRDDGDYDSKPSHIRQGAQDDDDSDLDI